MRVAYHQCGGIFALELRLALKVIGVNQKKLNRLTLA